MRDMERKSQLSWWGRQSLCKRVTLILVPVVVVVGLAVGLGVGLAVGKDSDGESSPSPTGPFPTSTSPPGTLWQPKVNSTWQIILSNPLDLSPDATSVDPDVSIYDIDLYDNSQEIIDTLHRLDKKVICYFSAGSYEPNRPDSDDFAEDDLGLELDGWPGEMWLKLGSENVRSIMKKRIALAGSKRCDAIDPDNVDGYQNENGLNLTAEDSIDFMRFLAKEAADHGLSIGLKNALNIIENVLNITHFSVNEQCAEYDECEDFTPFITAGKPVFHIEYPEDVPNVASNVRSELCQSAGNAEYEQGFSTVLKNMDLDGWVQFCDGSIAETALDTPNSD
ncbi:glycoside hydrolase family 114 protein [Patellaria atrata CBS 101060]|uniref:alpha-galactosidase n=1 Tax=Patellaria atrata CBS 101060 TaxID=1346257 RepID=A0A9P4VPI8_9PEZI|nr:glycoside hydrolase family 114 protein [Patellaria atrata CBS 101060]